MAVVRKRQEYQQVLVGNSVSTHVWSCRVDESERRRRPVIFAFHGRTDGGVVFERLAQELAAVADLVAADLPGHGATPTPRPAAAGYAQLVPAGVEVADALPDLVGADRRIIGLGHSMGGFALSQVVRRRPGVVAEVVLEAPPHPAFFRQREVRWAADGLLRLQSLSRQERMSYIVEQTGWDDPREAELWAITKEQADPRLIRSLGPWRTWLPQLVVGLPVPVTVLLGRRGPRADVALNRALARVASWGSRNRVRTVFLEAEHNLRREDASGYLAELARALRVDLGRETDSVAVAGADLSNALSR